MSSLLRRLMLRVRDPATTHVPRIEPLLTPRYAAIGDRPAFDAQTDINEKAVVSEVSDVVAATPSLQPLPRSVPDDRAAAPGINTHVNDRHVNNKRLGDPTTLAPAWSETERVEPLPLASAHAGAPIRTKSSPLAPAHADAPKLDPLATSAVQTWTSASVAPVLAPAERTHIDKAPSQRLLQPLVHPAQTLPATMTATHRATPGNAQRSREAEGPPAPSAAPTVTISIGHIEVGSTPVAAAPRPAPFRPSVSLSDFLGRQGGHRS
ncbi:hypothetical protein [Dyella subtropica]|uniref:hypothetical protein n=1 Tax=Dyella subtropica TaxID=2992127 RepID=UPI00224E7E89|nr:hypothetical protein [Dyella subtropica]